MPSKKLVFCFVLLSLAAGAAYYSLANPPQSMSNPTQNSPGEGQQPVEKAPDIATREPPSPSIAKTVSEQPDKQPAEQEAPATQELLIEPWEVATTRPSDEEFYQIVEHMRQNPNFLAGVMHEFQSETDPERLKWLAFMLGDLRDKPELTALAGQMLFSGDKQSTMSALALLSRLQKSDPAARDLVLQSLSASQDTEVLGASMNALARATSEVSYSQKQQLLQQLSPLTQHPDVLLRRRSYALLFRWVSDEPHLNQQLIAGLVDQDAKVRRSTVIGFIDNPQSDINVKLALMDMLNNTQELERNRKLAAGALKKLELKPDEEKHINAILKSFR